MVSQTGPRRGRRGQGALLDLSGGRSGAAEPPWQLELLQAGRSLCRPRVGQRWGGEWLRWPRGERRAGKAQQGRAWGRYAGEVDGQAQPAREAGCTFELLPLLARQPWESILSVGVLGRAGDWCKQGPLRRSPCPSSVSQWGLGGCTGVPRQTGQKWEGLSSLEARPPHPHSLPVTFIYGVWMHRLLWHRGHWA